MVRDYTYYSWKFILIQLFLLAANTKVKDQKMGFGKGPKANNGN